MLQLLGSLPQEVDHRCWYKRDAVHCERKVHAFLSGAFSWIKSVANTGGTLRLGRRLRENAHCFCRNGVLDCSTHLVCVDAKVQSKDGVSTSLLLYCTRSGACYRDLRMETDTPSRIGYCFLASVTQ